MRFPRFLSFLILLLSTILFAQSPTPNKMSEVTNLRLKSAYKTALIAQQNFAVAQQIAQKALADWNAVSEQAVVDEKLKPGTTFQVDVANDEVTIVPMHPLVAPATPSPAPPPLPETHVPSHPAPTPK